MKTLAKTAAHALSALGLVGAAAAPAFAEVREHSTMTVSTAGIDLGTAAGQKALDQRIEKAVRQVCRVTKFNTGTRLMSTDAMACLANARADAKRQVALLKDNEQRGG